MAFALMPLGRATVALATLLVLTDARALGSAAPFTPPRAGSAAGGESSSVGAPATDGLGGLRLRTQPMALIDGQWWRIGQQVRGAVLTSIHAGGVVLRHADGRTEQVSWMPANTTPPHGPRLR